MQAYDSVAIEADIELGGTDQLYNLLAGRTVMEAYGLAPQVVLTTPLLLSWDGAKMSSSVGNNIPLTAAPEEQFGRAMRIPDDMLEQWWALVVEQPVPDVEPMEAKLELARFIVRRSHGEDAARAAEAHFTRVVREGGAPEDVLEVALATDDPVHLPALIATAFGLSTSEARRMIAQGGVKLDGEPVSELDLPRSEVLGKVLQAGKRRFAKARRSRSLTAIRGLLHSFGRPRGRHGKPATQERLRSIRIRPFRTPSIWRPLARAEAFSLPALPGIGP